MSRALPLVLLSLLCATPAAAAVDCFEGNQAFAEERLDDAIEMFGAALSLAACRPDRVGLQLNLAVALGKRAANTADHCRAAELFESVTRSTAGAARDRLLVPWRIERHRCAVSRALDVQDVRTAAGELRRFVEVTDPTTDPQASVARERAEKQLASLRSTRLGRVSIQCPDGGRVSIDGLEELRACPAEWQDVPAGRHRVGWTDARGGMRPRTIDVTPGRLNVFAFARAAAPSPAPTTPPPATAVEPATRHTAPSRTAAWVATVGAAALVVGGGVTLLAALDAQSEREQARTDILVAQAQPQDFAADADAQARYADAQDRTVALGYAGYGAVALGAALGAVAIWLWTDDAAPTLSATPDGAELGLRVRF